MKSLGDQELPCSSSIGIQIELVNNVVSVEQPIFASLTTSTQFPSIPCSTKARNTAFNLMEFLFVVDEKETQGQLVFPCALQQLVQRENIISYAIVSLKSSLFSRSLYI